MTIKNALKTISRADAKRYIGEYFKTSCLIPESPKYTGSHFETLGSQSNDPDVINASDLLAVQTLSVQVPARAAIGILGGQSGTITELLAALPNGKSLSSLSDEEFTRWLGEDSPGQQLWDLLRRNGNGADGKTLTRWGVGPTTASKILARKRPELIPVEDSVITRVTNRGKQSSWQMWWEEMRTDSVLEERAEEIREDTGHGELSTLRVLDIVLWMSGRLTKTH